jgi:cytochrome c553
LAHILAQAGRGRAAGARRRGHLLGVLLLCIGMSALADDVAQLVATECAHCHGTDGNSAVPTFPKLAGLRPDYLAKQLREFAAGAAPAKIIGGLAPSAATARYNDVMTPIAAKLSAQEIDALAAYFGRQRRTQGAPQTPGMEDLGRRVYVEGNRESGVPACAGCHRPDGSGNERNPMVAGQNAGYVLAQLRAFRDDTRLNDRGMLMRTTAGRMTEQEMIAVAEYVAGLPATAGSRRGEGTQ